MVDNNSTQFIGQKVDVVESTNKSYVGLSGIIVDETKNTFTIEVNNVKKIILKSGTKFTIGKKMIRGKTITKRIEDRIKRGN